jgi:cytosine permease
MEIEWPRTLRAELDATPTPRRPWYRTAGPAYMGVFVWAPFFDSLWRQDVTVSSLQWLAGTAIVASVLCFALFYYPTAMLGYRTGRRLGVVASSTFGTQGSDWLTGVVLAVAEVVWFAVAIDYAVDATFRGLVACGGLPTTILQPWRVGPLVLRGPLFLATALFWVFITGMSSLLRLSGVIAALMKVYSPFAAILLTCCAIWLLPGLAGFEPGEVLEVTGSVQAVPAASMIPMATGFFAIAGLMGVDWGAASARRRDVLIGGLAGIVLAGAWTAIMSLIVVAGAMARLPGFHLDGADDPTSAPEFSFRWGIVHGLRGWPAAVVLCLLGLAALAPACFSSYLFIRKLFARWPGIRRIDWGWIGCTAGFLLVATGWPRRLESVAYFMGLIFAPAVGAMAGDWLRQRGGWAGVRPGIHPIGAAAWAAGVVVRPLLDLLAVRGLLPLASVLASPVAGFAVAAGSYVMLASLGLERPATAVDTFPGGSSEHEVIAAAGVDAPGRAPR